MSNSIIITNNTSANPQHWDVDYVVDEAGIAVATLETAGTFLDRHIQIGITTPAAEFTTSEQKVYVSSPGWVNSGSPSNPIWSVSTGAISATTAALSNPTAMMAPTGFTTTGSGSYYVTLNTTAGSVTPRAIVTTTGYVSSAQNTNATAISMPVSGSGDKLYIASNSITGSVYDLQSGSVAITTAITGLTTTTTNTGHSITVGSTITSGSVKGKATAGNTTGIVASGASNISNASTITPTVTGTTTIYVPNATHTLTGGGLTSGAGSASISVTCGYFDGTSYTNGDRVILSTAETTGYYKLQAFGSGTVTRAEINSSITEGYTSADSSSIAQQSISSNIGSANYYLKKSTLSAQSVNSSSTDQTIMISSGYYPDDRTVTINAMTTGKVTPSYADTGLSTYFNTTASGGNVIITPRYTVNTSGYLATVTNSTANTTTARFNIKITSINTTGVTTVSGTTATRATASIASSGWITATTISAATFSNSATTGSSYVDISNTTDAPILDSSGFLYINRGYTDNLKISLARLIPNDANITSSATMLQGTTAYDSDGKLYTGSIASKTSATYNTSSSDQTISSGQYLSGDQTIRAVTTSNITAANVKKGVTVKVGDSASAGRIINLTGTFTSAGTQSAGQTVATSAQILNGYSAWVNGAEVKGNVATKTTSNITESFTSTTGYINIPQGYFSEASSFTLSSGVYNADSSTSSNSTVTPSVMITSASTYGFITSTAGLSSYITINPNASATNWSVTPRANVTTSGYIPSGFKTGSAVSGSPTIAEGTNYYVPIVTPTVSASGTASISTNTISTNMVTASTSTYYIDANATGSYSVGGVMMECDAGVIPEYIYGPVTNPTSGTISKAATRIYIPEATFNTTCTITDITVTATPGTVSIADNNTAVTGKTRLTTSDFSIGTTTGNISSYYIALKATATANTVGTTGAISATSTASIPTDGYITSGTANSTASGVVTAKTSARDSSVYYIAIPEAEIDLVSTGTVTPSISLTTSNMTISETDNGISLVAVGGGETSVTVVSEVTQSGYVSSGTPLTSGNFTSSTTTSTIKYISGVKLEAPASGTRSFTITVPNGSTSDFIDFVFTVDSSGNVFIDDGT